MMSNSSLLAPVQQTEQKMNFPDRTGHFKTCDLKYGSSFTCKFSVFLGKVFRVC